MNVPDDYARFAWVDFLRPKFDAASEAFEQFLADTPYAAVSPLLWW